MHDASLHDRLREDRRGRVGKALEAVDDCDRDIGETARFEVVHDAQPELRFFGLLDPKPEHLLRSVGTDAEHDVARLLPDGSDERGFS